MPLGIEQERLSERKVMKQWYQGKLAERLLQATEMAKSRRLLRRGARKQQDGTLGMKDPALDNSNEEEDVNIRIGDEYYYGNLPTDEDNVQQKPAQGELPEIKKKGLLQKALPYLLAVGMGAGGGGAYATYTITKKLNKVVSGLTDTNTQYSLELMSNDSK